MCLAVLILIVLLLDRRSLGCSPVNTATIAGQPVTIYSGVQPGDGLILWRFQPMESREDNLIFNGYNISKDRPRHFISGLKAGEFNLANNDTHLEDAGIYQCIQSIPDQRSYRMKIGIAQLTVLSSAPQCGWNATSQSVVEGDRVQMWCSVDYLGNLHPVLEWLRDDGSTVSSEFSDMINTSVPFSLTTSVYETMTANDHNDSYVCKTYFKTPAIVPENTFTAINAPGYRHECRVTISVLFGPRNMSITPRKNTYIKGEQVRCSASGNPTPTYNWREIDSHNVVWGPFLTVDGTMEQRKVNTLLCTAENIVAGKKKTASEIITLSVAGTSLDSAYEKPLVVIIGSGAAVGGVALTVIGVIVWRLAKRKCHVQPNKNGNAERRDSPQDYESVNSGEMDSIQHTPDIELDQLQSTMTTETMDQSTVVTEGGVPVTDSMSLYDTLGDHPIIQEPRPYSTLEAANPEEEFNDAQEKTGKSSDYYNFDPNNVVTEQNIHSN